MKVTAFIDEVAGVNYFYPVRLNPFKKLAGKLFDILALKIIRS
jgi:hypothetical protein